MYADREYRRDGRHEATVDLCGGEQHLHARHTE